MDVTPAWHRAEAERLLVEASHAVHGPEWHQAFATRALAHATLATVPEPKPSQVYVDLRKPVSPWADGLQEVISYQGQAVSQDFAYRASHLAEVREMLQDEPHGTWHDNNAEDGYEAGAAPFPVG